MKFKEQSLQSKDECAEILIAHAEGRMQIEHQQWHEIRRIFDWRVKKRPFFNVYPVIIECLRNTNADIDCGAIERNVIHELGVVEVRTPSDSDVPPFLLGVDNNVLFEDGSKGSAVFVTSFQGEGAYSFNLKFGRKPIWKGMDGEMSVLTLMTRVAVGVLMLAGDPEFCSPVILSKDIGKPIDERLAVLRAKRRGVVGFTIGKSIAIGPHVRRPHFAIRWTGKGYATPRYVPVKGCMVHKNKLTSVPTGYADAETL